MKRLVIKTKVTGHYLEVMERFDLDLFEALKPIGVKMEIDQFTGSKTGDIVELRFISPLRAVWKSIITDHGSDENQAFFIDEGETLPFPLKKWKHRHIVKRLEDNYSLIVDDISYHSGSFLLDTLIYPFMLLSFLPRRKVYKRYFGS